MNEVQLGLSGKPIVRLEKKKGHIIYKTRDGKRVPGASTIAKIGDSMENIIHWAWDLGMQGIDYKSERGQAADAGTLAHFMVTCHLRNQDPDLTEFSPECVDLASNAFIKFLDLWAEEEMHVIDMEFPLVSEEFKFGGTIDMLATDRLGRMCLIDHKTSKRIYDGHLCQLSGYEQLLNESGRKIERRAIFRIGRKEKGDMELRWLPEMNKYFRVFQDQLNLYRSRKLM